MMQGLEERLRPPRQSAGSMLDWLAQQSVIVADTGDVDEISIYRPQDATTNPSLMMKVAQQPKNRPLLEAVKSGRRHEDIDLTMDRLLVRVGCEILSIIHGRVSTEVDARLSFDRGAMLSRARRLMQLFEAEGVGRDRVLIKIAATWEGIQAAEVLEREGIHCNLTLVFHMCQAVACASAGVRLISPFVGRILDWHRDAAGPAWDDAANRGHADPGVRSVAAIARYFKRCNLKTQVMAASFRNEEQVLALAGCDLLTISPGVLSKLESMPAQAREGMCLAPQDGDPQAPLRLNEAQFRAALNDSDMATHKLGEGIRIFAKDATQLEELLHA